MNQTRNQHQLFQSILTKFVINLPLAELEDPNRLAYQTEKAFYYYLDYILAIPRPQNWQQQRSEFLAKLSQYAPACIKVDPRKLILKTQQNKPVCGAIIFNKDESKVLMIKVRNKLGFPKGKWNQHESSRQCAAREVQQETGIYIHNKMDPNISIQFQSHGSNAYFYVAKGISEDDRIKIDTKEIDDIFWMRVEDLRATQWKLVQRSKIVWELFQKLQKQPPPKVQTFQTFLQKYRPDNSRRETTEVNPFLTFRLDRQSLKRALFQGMAE